VVGDAVDPGGGVKDELGLAISKRSPGSNEPRVDSLGNKPALLLPLKVVVTGVGSEAPVPRSNDLLTAGELELGSAEGLRGNRSVVVLAADAEKNLPNLDTSASSDGPAPCLAHTLLEPISSSARKHLVDPEHVEGMHTDSEMEGLLAGILEATRG
jgi:hypothetical protein